MPDTQAIEPITVDVISDVMCPWCYVGKRRLENALADVAGIDVVVNWQPFQLDPTIPPEGKDRRTYFKEKFNDDDRVRDMHAQLTELGRAEGIAFDFKAIERSPNTLDAHRVVRWAGIEGEKMQDAVVERLFSMFFVEGADMTRHESLVAAAADAGMDAPVVEALLAGDADRAAVEEEIATAQKIGVTGVPCFIIDNRYAVLGAQESSVIADAIRQSYQERQAGVRPPAEGGPEA